MKSVICALTAVGFFAGLALILAGQPVQANPAYAKATGKGCPTCHTAPPALNETGKKFQANGHKF